MSEFDKRPVPTTDVQGGFLSSRAAQELLELNICVVVVIFIVVVSIAGRVCKPKSQKQHLKVKFAKLN